MAPPVYDVESAKAALKAMGGSILFEKVLTSSDANGTGRLVIPKGQAEAHLPFIEEQQGTTLQATDPEGGKHSFRFRFWVNNQSRCVPTELLPATCPCVANSLRLLCCPLL
jgi:hypothetical protein